MKLGTFSISLTVKDLEASRLFYEKLGFGPFGGDAAHGYLVLKNGDHLIGLYQGMFDANMLTFNPGWDQSAGEVDPFTDIRDIHSELVAKGLKPAQVNLPQGGGIGSFVVVDPDGNPVLIDQHR
ncbi:MAG: catechol 2,3-dioxygenase-like lactoylglutathione lyase family enzyme [Yoonia sp.]|jgi:catechol 2,3-dioxygenase-like lactoylglutathione lyase family enzyme